MSGKKPGAKFTIIFLLFFSFVCSAFAEEVAIPHVNVSDSLPKDPSMNNGIPYIPLDSSKENIGAIVDNGQNLQLKDKKVKIRGEKAIDSIDIYDQLSKMQQDEIKRFCVNIQDPARQAYFMIQTVKLQNLRKDVDNRIKLLEQKKQEYQDWLKRRNDFLDRAKLSLVDIYSKMSADSAASQLEQLDELSAAAIIMKLKPRLSAQIMQDMPPEKAASLSRIILDSQKIPSKSSANINDNATDIPQPVDEN